MEKSRKKTLDITPTGGMGYAAQWVIPPGGSVPCQVVVTGRTAPQAGRGAAQ